MESKNRIIVEDTDASERIDSFLSECLDKSRTYIQKQIELGNIKVNDNEINKKYLLKADDIITFSLEEENIVEDIKPVKMDLDIVYEDDDLIVINKPKGLVVHPGAGNHDNTLVNGILYYTNQLSDVNGSIRPGIVHRIDKDTSGLLIICKNNNAHNSIAKQLQDKTCFRKYICIVEGTITNDEGVIDAPIGRDPHNRQKMCVTDRNSKEAITNFKVLDRFSNYSLVECELKTGRTHQIRVHMSYIKHPVVNDSKYNRHQLDESGQYLHAYYLSFIHPRTNKRIELQTKIPNYIINFIKENGGKYNETI